MEGRGKELGVRRPKKMKFVGFGGYLCWETL